MRAAPVAAETVKIVPLEAQLQGGQIRATARVHNLGDEPLVLDRNQFAVVVPGHGEYFRSGTGHAFRVPPQGMLEVGTVARVNGVDTGTIPGLFVRFDGLYRAGERVIVEPARFGHPEGSAGEVRRDFAMPDPQLIQTADESSLVSKIARSVQRDREAAESAEAMQSTDSRQYSGKRSKISTEVKVATLPLVVSEGVSTEARTIGEELLLTELQRAGFSAIGTEDVNAMIGFEQIKDAVGCEDAQCMAEIGNALGVEFLATGRISQLDDTTLLLLKILDVKQGSVLARDQRIVEGGLGHLPRVMAEGVQALVAQSKL